MSPIRSTPTTTLISYPYDSTGIVASAALQPVSATKIASTSPTYQKPASPPLSALAQYVTQFRQGLAQVNIISQYAAAQRLQDRTQGISLFSGASRTAGAIQAGADLLGTITPQSSVIDGVGKLGQEYSVDTIGAAALQSVGKQLGVDITKISAKELYTSLSNWLLRGTSSPAPSVLASAEAAGASTGSSLASTLGGALGFAGAAYSAYGLISNFGKSDPVTGAIQGAATGAYIGSIVPGIGTLIGGAIGAVAGGLLGCIKTGKHKDQIARDHVRDFLQGRGILNADHQLQLADGSMYEIGKDGGFTLLNTDGTTRHAYDVDFKNPLAGQVVGWIQPLVSLLTGGNMKLKDDFTGYFTNAALSNATDLESARTNVLKLYQQSQATPEIMVQGITALTQNGAISQQELPAYVGGLKDLFRSGLVSSKNTAISILRSPES